MTNVPLEDLRIKARMSGRTWRLIKREKVTPLPWEKICTAPLWTNKEKYGALWEKSV